MAIGERKSNNLDRTAPQREAIGIEPANLDVEGFRRLCQEIVSTARVPMTLEHSGVLQWYE